MVMKLKNFDHEQRLRYGITRSATGKGAKTVHERKHLRPLSAPLKRGSRQSNSLAMLKAAAGEKYVGDTIRYQRLLSVKEHRAYHKRRLERIILGHNCG